MIQQIQSVCRDCNGQGETISEKDRCPECRGKKLVPETKIVEVPIDKGMRSGQQVRLSGEGNHEPGVPPGDLIIEISEKPDPNFERRGQDLIHKRKINLLEALTGYKFALTHLDDRVLIVEGKPGEIVEPNAIRVIRDEGMPLHRNPFVKGRLFVVFEVEFPKPGQLSEKDRKALEKILPARRPLPSALPADAEEVVAEEYNEVKHAPAAESSRGEAYEEDQQDRRGGATCVHQ